ncbi:MAG: 4Fe-4S binding protein [Deltaproteobacteria bacterium]|nr:4Fe-4S binding protein [Deltaproteobacteria bacterium]
MVQNRTGILRTLPVEMEIPSGSKAQTYEKASEIIKNAPRPLAVAKCSCRKLARRAGRGCDRPVENCIVFGDHARFQIEHGHGREIDETEAQKILKEAEQAGLVHNIMNFTESEGSSYLCNCCSCCCSTLAAINRLSPEGEISGLSPSNFVAEVDIDQCSGCELCETYCTLKAIHIEDGMPVVNAARCLGCGLCATHCPVAAIRLVRRPEDRMIHYPKTMDDLYNRVRSEVRDLRKGVSERKPG